MIKDYGLRLPRDKYDIEAATKLVDAGWAEIAHLLPEILEWLQDVNWPVALIFQPLLVDAGERLSPFLRAIFATDDDVWKFNILVYIVSQSPALAIAMRADLERLANIPTIGELLEEVPDAAREILATMRTGA